MMKRQGQQALFAGVYRKITALSFIFFLTACATPTELIEKKKIHENATITARSCFTPL